MLVAQWRRSRGGGMPPIVETRRKIVNVVGIFVVKQIGLCSHCDVLSERVHLRFSVTRSFMHSHSPLACRGGGARRWLKGAPHYSGIRIMMGHCIFFF